MKRSNNDFLRDVGIILLSIFVAVILVKTRILSHLLFLTGKTLFLNSFISGFFFTSVFTTAPAIAALGEIARANSLFFTALFGALGAMCGDFLIFRFMRDSFSGHLIELVKTKGTRKRIKSIFKLRFFRWLTFLIGGLIIASPLPDELGLSLLGFSKIKTSRFLPLSFTFNFIGIIFVGLVARALF